MMENEIESQGDRKSIDLVFVVVVLVAVFAIATSILFVEILSLRGLNSDLRSDLRASESQLKSLNLAHLALENEHETYVSTHSYSNAEYDEARFDFYYSKPENQKFGVSVLEDEILGLQWSEPYQAGVFDCSEMSACLERYLENQGWHILIVVGDAPTGGNGHAWLLVETNAGGYMPVEAQSFRVVLWDDTYFDNYYVYDESFMNIQEAVDYNETEFDWWTVGSSPLET